MVVDACAVFQGKKINGITTKEQKKSTPMNIYKDKCRYHMIKYSMWEIFNLTDPIEKPK